MTVFQDSYILISKKKTPMNLSFMLVKLYGIVEIENMYNVTSVMKCFDNDVLKTANIFN
jgi:hypothetical protein